METHVTGQLSTRGELIYQDTTFGRKEFPKAAVFLLELITCLAKRFRYTTKPLKIEPKHLLDPLLSHQLFHFLTSPSEQIAQVQELINLRNNIGIKEIPIIIWEPAPPSCMPENLSMFLEAIKLVDVVSPNHIELAAFFGIASDNDEQFDRDIIEELARKCVLSSIGHNNQGTVVIRAGHEGCCVYSRRRKNFVWLPPFYENSPKVIDPTGAGNAFLGGFAVGLSETADDVLASCYGTVASSFALEQIGLPILNPLQCSTEYEANVCLETWNGASVRARLREYTTRVGTALVNPA